MKRTAFIISILIMALGVQELHSQSLRQLMRKKIIEDNLEAQAKRDSAQALE